MNIVFFDFDGTITNKDSLADFIQFAVGKPKYYLGLIFLSPVLIKYKLKFIPNDIAKEKLISYFFKNWKAETFKQIANKYAKEHIINIIRPQALKKIKWHQEQKDRIVLVSASINLWLQPWCEYYNIELLATELEIKQGYLTGNFSTKNCYGLEKENRINMQYNLEDYEKVYAYGDSIGDKELLALADYAYYKPFRGKNNK